jgi:hypothetical protein
MTEVTLKDIENQLVLAGNGNYVPNTNNRITHAASLIATVAGVNLSSTLSDDDKQDFLSTASTYMGKDNILQSHEFATLQDDAVDIAMSES